MKPLKDRFYTKFFVHPATGCWVWTGSRTELGYGKIGLGSRKAGTRKAHRVSWEIHVGPIPSGMNVLHRCDNPPCVNPDHLWIGTLSDNMRDCVAKGRISKERPTVRGTRNHNAKLSEEAVRHIRRNEMPKRAYGRLYGISATAVSHILNGINWKHLR